MFTTLLVGRLGGVPVTGPTLIAVSSTARPPILSPTLAMNEEVSRRLAAGLATLPLGFGEAGLPVLPELADQLARSAGHARYGPVAGVPELRHAAAGYWERRGLPTDPDLVIAGPGSKPLLFALLHAVGGAVAVASPCWVSYGAQAALVGRSTHVIPTLPGEGGAPDPRLLDEAARHAHAGGDPIHAVILTLPDNPTGTLADASTIRRLCEIAESHEILVISDEIYRDLVHDPSRPFLSPVELVPDGVVVTSGLSKSLALGGWRIGVARLPDSALGHRLRDHLLAVASEVWSSPAQPVQLAAAWAFGEPPEVRERIFLSRRLHASVVKAASQVLTTAGVQHAAPQAAFYLYADFEEHRKRLAKSWSIRTGSDVARVLLGDLGVATLPGAAFGEADEVLALRIATSLLYGQDDEHRLAALHDEDPSSLPWISAQLDVLASSLTDLLHAG